MSTVRFERLNKDTIAIIQDYEGTNTDVIEISMSQIDSVIEELSKFRDRRAYKPLPSIAEMRAAIRKSTMESVDAHIKRRGFTDPIRTGVKEESNE